MTNNEYQTLGMSQHMLREFRVQCNQREQAALDADKQPIAYPSFSQELLTYPIFSNHACNDQNAQELLAEGVQEDDCQRWRFFYTPDPDKLPHESRWELMNQQLATLKHRYRNMTSPRLAVFSGAVLMIIFLVMRGHFLLPALPILLLVWYWHYSGENLRQARLELITHLQQMGELHEQAATIRHQFDSLPPPAEVGHLKQLYHKAVEQLLRNTLLHVLRPHELGNMADVLKKYRWEGFITESWGLLQVPLKSQENSEISQTLLDESNIALSALQRELNGRKGETLFRVQYLHIWLLTESGLLHGYAYYDRVMDYFLHEEHAFYPYAQLAHSRITEQPLPEQASLKQHLPDTLHRRYFRQPLTIFSVGTVAGKNHECALLPATERPLHQTQWLDSYGLDADVSRLNRRLHERMYGSAQAA
jgi:hypothetical protein